MIGYLIFQERETLVDGGRNKFVSVTIPDNIARPQFDVIVQGSGQVVQDPQILVDRFVKGITVEGGEEALVVGRELVLDYAFDVCGKERHGNMSMGIITKIGDLPSRRLRQFINTGLQVQPKED